MGLIFTKTCVLCCKTLDADAGKAAMLCPACAKAVREQYRCTERFQIDGADDAAAPLLYTGAVADAVKRFKFKHRQHYADWFAAQTLPVLAERLDTWMPDLVTFIPIGVLHWYQRGYNQAELLAQRIAAPFSLSCAATLWKRPFTPKQSGRKDAAARDKNAKRALWIRAGIDLSGKSVVLVDDIITAGSTAAAAVKLLREMGATHVYVLAPTRTPSGRRD